MKHTISLLLIICTLFVLSSCGLLHEHTYGDWKTVKNATCTEEGLKERTCSCGAKETLPIEPIPHSWKAATCESPKTCSNCGKTEGSALGHSWTEATCTSPKTCSRCRKTEGGFLGHDWKEATCTSPKTCLRCGKAEGALASHKVVDYKCSVCGKTVVNKSDIPNILDIVSMTYKVNSVGGIDQWIVIENKSKSKTIKYVEYNVSFYNKVGDKIRDDVSRRDFAVLRYTGPLAPGEQSNKNQYWKACFYNSTFGGTMYMNSITITYMDGSILTLDDSVAGYAVVAWR